MGRDVSIVIRAQDNYSQAITTMRNANQAFNKDLTGLSSKLDALNKNKITLKVEAEKAKSALKEAEKQFAATGDAADRLKMELANADYENVSQNLDLVSRNARQTRKDILSLTDAVSKADNRAGSGGGGLLKSLATAGLTQLIGSQLASTANTLVGSAYGSEIGSMFSNVLSSAVTGAALGSMAGPIGTAIGAAVGGAAGVISGATGIYENQDNAFKSYYQDQYNAVKETQDTALTSGSGIASIREQNRISFATLLGGDQQAGDFLGQLTDFAAATPFEYDDLTTISKTLLAYSYKQEELIPLLTKVGDAGSALGMNKEDMTYVATALGRMQTTGKTTLEYLNPLLERGIPVWGYLAEASGKTKKEVQEMVSKGLVPGAEAAKAIADYMGRDFAGNMAKQSQTYSGLISTLEDANNQINNAMGAGYNDERKKGLQEQIDYLSGESGTKMEEAYKQIGQWQASLENLAEQYQRNAISAVMSGNITDEFTAETQKRLTSMYEEYTKYAADGSEEAGAKMGALLAEAQAIAQNEYNASEGAQLAIQTNKTLADNIKNDAAVNSAFWDAGYQMGKQFSLGMASAMSVDTPSDWFGSGILGNRNWTAGGNAYGLSYVPYNDYPAMLHEGERVLTASENRDYNKSASAIITGNTFVVREEADIQRVANEVINLMSNAYIAAE